MPRSAGQPHVEWIVSHRLRIGDAPLPIRLRQHDRLDEGFQVPAQTASGCRVREPPGQQVEHLGILGPGRLATEILRALHEADTEQRLPETVDRHPRE